MGCRLCSIAFAGVNNGKVTNIQKSQDAQHMETNASKVAVVVLFVVVVYLFACFYCFFPKQKLHDSLTNTYQHIANSYSLSGVSV